MFPGLINSTTMDYFHPWPRDALESVAMNFLMDVDLSTEDIKTGMASCMADVHLGIGRINKEYLTKERR
jgi:dynein heavy chain